MGHSKYSKIAKKIWKFIWEDDSIWSWLVNIILAYVLIKFIVYPGLGFLLGTGYPIVAVVSNSMEHTQEFDEWWHSQEDFYLNNEITKEDFKSFPFSSGFNKGDIMVLKGKKPNNIQVGNILVFESSKNWPRADPIIHRIIKKWEEDDEYHFQTKGDRNPHSINNCDKTGCLDETDISEDQVIGITLFKIPYLGYIKIWAFEIWKLVSGGLANVLSQM